MPAKYLGTLRGGERRARKAEILSRAEESYRMGSRRPPSAFRPFKTDRRRVTKTSSYTERFHRKYGDVGGNLRTIAKVSHDDVAPGASLPAYTAALRDVFDRGLAAWSTGHRPGATQSQWGYARVYSFILSGRTRHTADADIARSIGAKVRKVSR